jgi:hypothetical protein
LHAVQNLFPFYHTDFAFGHHCWPHARDSISLPENRRRPNCFDFVFDFITVDTFSAVVCKVLGKCICLGMPVPFQSGPKFFLPLSITFHTWWMCWLVRFLKWFRVLPTYDVVLVADFAMEVVDHHTLPAVVVVEASSVS